MEQTCKSQQQDMLQVLCAGVYHSYLTERESYLINGLQWPQTVV